MGLELAERWLRAHGEADPATAARKGAARAARWPSPVGAAWPSLLTALDAAAPLFVLGRPARASRLDDEAFAALDARLQHHALREVRLLWLLARSPLLEARYPDEPPAAKAHPLEALADVIRERQGHKNHEFDVIVVGSGAGGAPLAWALARGGQRVCVVESGGLQVPSTAEAAVERYFLEQGMLGSIEGGGTALVLAGNAIGGTTVINSGTSLRPRPERLEAWDREWGTSFSDGGLDPFLDRVSERIGVAEIPEDLLDASAKLVRLGLERIGRPGAFPLSRNAPDCVGSARCCFGCPTGAKLSTDRSFVPGAIEAGATLLARSTVLRVRADAGGVDVLVRTPDGIRRLRAGRVVLAAGAVATPGILRRSRIGSTWKVAGDHLRIHPASKVFGWMPEALPHGGVPQALGYRPPDLPRVTFEGAHTPPSVTATVLQAAGQRHRAWMANHDHLANYGLMVRDRGTGTVREVGGKKVLRYALHPDDGKDLGAGLLIAGEALFAAGAERVVLPLCGQPAEVESLEALRALRPEDFTRRNLLTSGFHPQGTAGIGRVVDADLDVVGEPRVSVCDASVLPDSPGVNPQVTIMALSLRLADRLLEA